MWFEQSDSHWRLEPEDYDYEHRPPAPSQLEGHEETIATRPAAPCSINVRERHRSHGVSDHQNQKDFRRAFRGPAKEGRQDHRPSEVRQPSQMELI